MTLPHLHRSPTLLARSAVVALVLAAGAAGTAASQDHSDAQGPARVAILAGADASGADVAAATAAAGDGAQVRHATGSFEAQAQATRLAAEGYDTVIGVGAQARAAVSQADAGEVGAGTHWQAAAR
jgi:hypothetical protein